MLVLLTLLECRADLEPAKKATRAFRRDVYPAPKLMLRGDA